jgi:hypothetical protein
MTSLPTLVELGRHQELLSFPKGPLLAEALLTACWKLCLLHDLFQQPH